MCRFFCEIQGKSLRIAAKTKIPILMRMLIEAGCDPNDGPTMITTITQNSKEMLDLLLSYGASPDKGVHVAVHDGLDNMLIFLIRAGADAR